MAAAADAVPCEMMFGRIAEKEPLKIRVEQKLLLGEKQLILPGNVKKMLSENELNTGDGVLLLRMQGGQRFLITDKITKGAGV
ncbi:MAG: DUF2577 domain-containing protein [Oscillospiraceae bacterium]|nr:DUF2577 domain-containing protein [Oscillospiraceae bacterium]